MKSDFSLIAALTVLATQVSAHYIFQQFTYGGTTYPVYKYIRPNTNYNSPVTDLTSNELRCNVGGASGSATDTLSLTAGSSFSFTADIAVYHNGPASVYMAKAPSTAASFDGSGQVWFKIAELGPTFSDGAVTWPLYQTYTFQIPVGTPNGYYLIRMEQLAVHNPYPAGIPQFYVACAQVAINAGGNGVPGPLVSIPGYIKGDEPGYVVNIYNNFTNYTIPGPPVWSGGNPGGGSSSTTTSRAVSTTLITTRTTATTTKILTTTSAVGGGSGVIVPKYGQCGGQGWTGGTICATGSTCTALNAFYSQCL